MPLTTAARVAATIENLARRTESCPGFRAAAAGRGLLAAVQLVNGHVARAFLEESKQAPCILLEKIGRSVDAVRSGVSSIAKLAQVAASLGARLLRSVAEASRRDFIEWLARSLEGGAGEAHRWTNAAPWARRWQVVPSPPQERPAQGDGGQAFALLPAGNPCDEAARPLHTLLDSDLRLETHGSVATFADGRGAGAAPPRRRRIGGEQEQDTPDGTLGLHRADSTP